MHLYFVTWTRESHLASASAGAVILNENILLKVLSSPTDVESKKQGFQKQFYATRDVESKSRVSVISRGVLLLREGWCDITGNT